MATRLPRAATRWAQDVEEITTCVQLTGFLGQGGFASVYRGPYRLCY